MRAQNKAGIASSAFAMFQRDIVIYVVLFATSVITARVMQPTGMGMWSVLLLVPSFAAAFGRLQTDTAAVYFIAQKRYAVGEIAFALNVIAATMTCAVAAAFFGLQGWLFSSPLHEIEGRRYLVYLVLLNVPFELIAMNYLYLLLGAEDVVWYNRHNVIKSLLPAVAGTVAILIVGPSLTVLAVTIVCGDAVAAAHGVWCVHSRQPLKITWGLKLYGDVLKFGIKLYVASVLSFLSVYLVGLIVAIYLTAAEVAFFQIAQARAILLAQIASAVGTVLYARVSSLGSDSNDGTQLAVTTFRITLLLTGCAALAALALAYPAVHLIYGAAYGGVVLPLLIFLPAVAIDSAGGPLNQFYIGRGRPGVTTIFVLVALISQLATLWIAVPRWGVTGAAIATASAMALGTVVRILAFFMMFKVRLKDMLRPTRADFLFVFGFVRSRLASAMAAVPLLRPR